LLAHPRIKGFDHTGNCIKAAAAIRKRPDTREHDPVGARHKIGVARHHDRLIVPRFPRRTFEGFGGRMQIA
jgi:hypothetical protein